MTDVEAKTPTKRRSDKKDFGNAKKQKVSPKKQDKLNKTNVQNNNEKLKGNKKNIENKNGSPKKLKPFVGTSKITPTKQQTGNKKVTEQNKEKNETKKPRKNFYTALKGRINSDEKDAALKSIEEKIQAIEGRDEITKTAKRKLKLLHRLKRVAMGENGSQPQPNRVGNKSEEKKRNEGKKKGSETTNAAQANIGTKNANKAVVKGQKVNELNKKQAAVDKKQINNKTKNIKAVQKEESSDEDESENELQEEESDEEIDDEQDEVESDDDSGDEEGNEEGDEEESEVEGEEDEDSDEDDSDEDSPPPQVSNKKQKKK